MSGEDSNSHTELEIGRTLQRAREKRGLSLQQVEEATKIRTRYLRDLENENFDVLPTVYILGSLKTYAEHLGLDGAAMTRELRRRQASLQTELDQAPEVPPSGEPRGLLAYLGRLVGIGETVEDEAGTMAPVRRPGLYVSLAVVLVFVLVTYLASTIRGEVRSSVSVVQEPTVSQIPSGIALVGDVESDERNSGDVNKENQPEKQPNVPPEDTGKVWKAGSARSGQDKNAPLTAQVSSASAAALASASASASADASASVSPASTGHSTESASSPATVTPAPTGVRPEPVVREQPDDAGRDMAAAPTDDPSTRAPGGPDPSPGFQQKQKGPVASTPPGNTVSTKVKISTNVKKTVHSTP
jgi:transcriptional regulator with XRE-family HTH domain